MRLLAHFLVTVFSLLFFCTLLVAGQAPIAIAQLRCEYSINPIGVDVVQPHFNWILQSGQRGQKQTAYHILVATSRNKLNQNIGDMWDSGRVDSEQSVHIHYDGRPLQSNHTYFWKVRVWDKDGRPSAFSKTASFGTALLHEEDWQAQWIGLGVGQDPHNEKGFYSSPKEQPGTVDSIKVDSRAHLLRKEVKLSGTIRRARVYVTGLGYYELFINGKRVGDKVLNPAKTFYRKQVLYDAYDVKELLQAGENAIGIMLGNGWFNPLKKWWSWHMQWYGSKRAILQLHIEYDDGSNQIITTDKTWRASAGPIISSCIYDGEVYNANLEQPGWNEPGFDDSSWENVHVVSPPGGKMISQMMEPIKVIDMIEPVTITRPDSETLVYDMGQNFAGWVKIRVQGASGSKVIIRYAENIKKDGHIDPITNNLAASMDVYILKGAAAEEYEPRFTYHGFRYVEISGEPDLPHIESVRGCVVHSAMPETGEFETDNEVINHIHHCTVWSQCSNLMGMPTDCPQRDERLGWMGDAHVTAEEAMHNYHMPLFYRNWLRAIRSTQDEKSGDIPYISPRPYMDPGTPAWSSAYPLIVWYYYLHYGDIEILKDHIDSIVRYVDFLNSTANHYILPHDRYGDWVSVVKGWKRGQPESVATGYFYYDAVILARIARILGRPNQAAYYANLAQNIKKAYNENYFHSGLHQYEKGTQMSNAFPLFLDIVPKDFEQAVAENLVNDIVKNHQGHLTTGILGTKYVMEALTQHRRSDIAFLLATQVDYPSWYDMCRSRTTLSERWDQGGSNNHVMFGSIDAWFYRTLAGIQPDPARPGYKNIIIRPFINPALGRVRASIRTVRGRVSSEWAYRDGSYDLDIEIPVNAEAVVHLPATKPELVTEGGRPVASLSHVRFVRKEKERLLYRVDAGRYHFEVKRADAVMPHLYASKPEILPETNLVKKPDSVVVRLECATKNALIRYTLDGRDPDEASPAYEHPLVLNNSTMVKARAFKRGFRPSYTQSRFYAFVDPQKNGLQYELFLGDFERLPDFREIEPIQKGVVLQPDLAALECPGYNFALRFSGWIEIPKTGEYIFYTQSNDGSRLFIDERLAVDNDGEHGTQEKSGCMHLTAGRHRFILTYFQSGGSKTLKVFLEGAGIEKQLLPATMLWR